jgi:hypothetical protein
MVVTTVVGSSVELVDAIEEELPDTGMRVVLIATTTVVLTMALVWTVMPEVGQGVPGVTVVRRLADAEEAGENMIAPGPSEENGRAGERNVDVGIAGALPISEVTTTTVVVVMVTAGTDGSGATGMEMKVEAMTLNAERSARSARDLMGAIWCVLVML